MTVLNKPYTRSSGIEITKNNPYLHENNNRQMRRKREKPFIGNGKNYPITVVDNIKYLRLIQRVPFKMVKGKMFGGNVILHYLAV